MQSELPEDSRTNRWAPDASGDAAYPMPSPEAVPPSSLFRPSLRQCGESQNHKEVLGHRAVLA